MAVVPDLPAPPGPGGIQDIQSSSDYRVTGQGSNVTARRERSEATGKKEGGLKLNVETN